MVTCQTVKAAQKRIAAGVLLGEHMADTQGGHIYNSYPSDFTEVTLDYEINLMPNNQLIK